MKNVICSSVITSRGRTYNILDDLIALNATEEGKIFVEGAQVVQRDIMATNGVVHVIDEVIIPQEGESAICVSDRDASPSDFLCTA